MLSIVVTFLNKSVFKWFQPFSIIIVLIWCLGGLYTDEINNIALYRNSVDDYYEVPSVYDDGNEIYSELDNETKKYYEEPVKYADKNNIETDISYVRK